MVVSLTEDMRAELAAIPAGQTRTIEGDPTDEACWSWALYGGSGPPVDPQDVFGFVGLDTAGWNRRVAKALDGQLAAELPASFTKADIDGLREMRRAIAVGEVTPLEAVRHLMSWVIVRAGLEPTSAGWTPYKICMHFPTDEGVTYEHWWLEIDGVTVEKLITWRDCYIYRRGPEAANYTRVEVPITGIHQAQVDRILNIVRQGTDKPSQEWS